VVKKFQDSIPFRAEGTMGKRMLAQVFYAYRFSINDFKTHRAACPTIRANRGDYFHYLPPFG